MAKVLKYNLCTPVNLGTDEDPQIREIISPVTMGWSKINEEIARKEAHRGEITIEEVEDSVTKPTQLDALEAQVVYTAMMTDTLLEEV